MSQESFKNNLEIEIKAQLMDRTAFAEKLLAIGFHLVTPETIERNVLYDTAEGLLRQQRQILRIRQYGSHWVLTHKISVANETAPTHKTRVETETEVGDGQVLAMIFEKLGYQPIFIYEKLRAEWADGNGHIVVDVTPIGDFVELEGEPAWIDATAARLGILPSQYLTASYAQLFLDWKNATKHSATNMTFAELGINP